MNRLDNVGKSLERMEKIDKTSYKDIKPKTDMTLREAETKIKSMYRKTPEHIKTINESLEGKTYPETNVMYRKNNIAIEGKLKEGVFPKFNSKFDVILPKEYWKQSSEKQFSFCMNPLKNKVEQNPDWAKKNFTPRQLAQIEYGGPRIDGYVWHHNEQSGKMQLVDRKIHETCRHTGGNSLWGNNC